MEQKETGAKMYGKVSRTKEKRLKGQMRRSNRYGDVVLMKDNQKTAKTAKIMVKSICKQSR